MDQLLSDEQLTQLSVFISNAMGLYFPPGRWKDLERQMKLAAREFGYPDVGSFIRWLQSSPLSQEQVETLSSYLTISETYFWREPRVFETLRDQIFPEIIRTRCSGEKHIRLWSAGCATGEEPYSIAIALRQAVPALKDWRITLLATDINPRILHRAAAGVFGEWSFRNVPPDFKNRYFTPIAKGKYEICPEIRKMVKFAYLNLAVDSFPTPVNNTNSMDLIFCRNVLMYFEPSLARLIGQRFYQCLVEGGWFLVSSSELSQYAYSQFTTVNFPGTILYRKDSKKPRQQGISPPMMPVPVPAVKPPHSLPAAANASPLRLSHLRSQPEALHTSENTINEPETALPEDVEKTVRVLANQGKLSEAWTACENAITADKLNPGLQYLGAIILQELNRDVEAVSLLKRALYLDPNFLLAHFTMGTLKQRGSDAAAAAKSFKNVLDLLENYQPDDILLETEGLTAGRLREIVNTTLKIGA